MMNADERLKICEKCPIVKIDEIYGPTCDSSKYLNPKTGDVSRIPMPGFIRGCNCRLKWKTLNPDAHCVCGKW